MSFDPSSDLPPHIDSTPEERSWGICAHLSSLLAMWLGGFAFLGPLVVWLIKRDQMPFVNDQGKEALNFNLTMLISWFVLGIFSLLLMLVTFGLGLVVIIPLSLALLAIQIVFPIMGAVKSNVGTVYRYPFILRLVK